MTRLLQWAFPWTSWLISRNRRVVETTVRLVMVSTMMSVGAWGAYSWWQG
jgi:hypothetical protein